MHLKKKGLVYNVAYGWKDDNKRPEKASLCRLFWAFLKGLFLAWPGVLLMMTIFYGLTFTIGGIFGKRPPIFKGEEEKMGNEDVLVRYEHWPTIRGFRPLPIHLVIIYVAYKLITTMVPGIIAAAGHKAVALAKFSVSSSGLIFWEIVLGVSILLWLVFRFPKTEVGRMVVGYAKAKKEKICPEVEFV